jgi:hypothetical protein
MNIVSKWLILIVVQVVGPSTTKPSVPENVVIHGTVRDPYGGVIWRARVQSKDLEGTEPSQTPERQGLAQSLETDQYGQFALKLPPGSYRVCVTGGEAFTPNCRDVDAKMGGDLTVDFCFCFYAVYKQNHEPVASEVMDQRLRALAGKDATDCGHVEVNARTEEASACAMRTFKAHKAFFVRYDMEGIDAALADGIATDSAGNGYGIIFDSMGLNSSGLPKGATMPDGSHTVVLACPRPLKLRKAVRGKVTCFGESQHFFWDEAEGSHSK